MKVFLDDERQAPDGWVLARWPEEVVSFLESGAVEALSLDHDLGDERRTGYDVLVWVEEAVATRGFHPPAISVHSANAGARPRMLAAVESIRRLAAAVGSDPPRGRVMVDP